MSFFQYFQNILYPFTTQTDTTIINDTVQDLTTRVTTYITPQSLQNLTIGYKVQDGETPEMVAYTLYGDPTLHWTILYVNSISDVYAEWPLSGNALSDYLNDKYSDLTKYPQGPDTIKHYTLLPEGIVADPVWVQKTYGSAYLGVETYRDIEVANNEALRYIKVISPAFIGDFARQFISELKK